MVCFTCNWPMRKVATEVADDNLMAIGNLLRCSKCGCGYKESTEEWLTDEELAKEL